MFLYNLLLNLFSPLILIIILFKIGMKELFERTGFQVRPFKKTIWIHAASVGEVNAVETLLKEIVFRYCPNYEIVVTTMTITGLSVIKSKKLPINYFLIPLDFSFFISSFLKRISPKILLIVETELWPNMIFQTAKKKIPIVIINGRLSPKSVINYRKSIFFFRNIISSVSAINAQSNDDADRFKSLNFKNINNCGNLKFSLQLKEFDQVITMKKLGIDSKDFVVVWGSSRPGEEKLILDIYPKLKNEIPNLKIIIVPRHLNRIPQVKELFSEIGYSIFSQLQDKNYKILIVDEIGVLIQFYSACDLAIIGGSFFDFGGHNPLEPAFYGKPILIGKFHSSCKESVKELKNNGLDIVSSNELSNKIIELFNNENLRISMGKKSQEVIGKNQGSIEKNLSLIEKYL